jgi:hypothetical protein
MEEIGLGILGLVSLACIGYFFLLSPLGWVVYFIVTTVQIARSR